MLPWIPFPSRVALLLLFLVGLLPCGTGSVVLADSEKAPPSNVRPNVILMMADDLGYGDPGYMGNEELRTPNLDAMAAAGLQFTRFYSAAPVCSPTRGSCLTGRHPYRYGITYANTGRMPAEELTLAELLSEQNYTTGQFGKWHLGTFDRARRGNTGGSRYKSKDADRYAPPWDHGFDICFSTERRVPTWDPLYEPQERHRATWWDPVPDLVHTFPFGWPYWSNKEKINKGLRGDDSRLLMDHAIPFIRGAVKDGRPFLSVIWFHAPHLPVVAGPQYTKRFAKFDKYKQHYYGCVTAMDEQIGRLRKELRGLGVAEHTMLWFCSDNGPEGKKTAPGSTGGLRGRKRDLFEGGIRVPGLLEWPAKVKPGSVTDIPACTSDYLPTVLDVLGLKMPDDRPIDGVSLQPLLEGNMKRRSKPIGFESESRIALIEDRYKLIGMALPKELTGTLSRKLADKENAGLAPAMMLFDLIDDPAEAYDIAGKHPEIVKRLTATLNAWRDSCTRSLAGNDYP